MKVNKWYFSTDKPGIYVPYIKSCDSYTDVITGYTKQVSKVIPLEEVYGTSRYFAMLVRKSGVKYSLDQRLNLIDFLTHKFNGTLVEMTFRHLKTSNFYSVVQVLPDCTNDTEWDCIVIYRKFGHPQLYARRLSEFLKKFKYNG